MTVTSLRFKDDQYKKVKDLAKFYGNSVTEFMRQTVMDRINDENDYNDAIKNLKESHGKTVKRDEIIKRLNIQWYFITGNSQKRPTRISPKWISKSKFVSLNG